MASVIHAKRGTVNSSIVRTGVQGFIATLTPLERFRRYCQFDPTTGCVLWTGGTTSGRGNSTTYGSFWYEGRRWFTHRWAAIHIHGMEPEHIAGHHVDHCCDLYRHGGAEPLAPNTLCVQHVRALTPRDNSLDRWARQQFATLTNGYGEAEPSYGGLQAPAPALPTYRPPAWLGVDSPVISADDDCPF